MTKTIAEADRSGKNGKSAGGRKPRAPRKKVPAAPPEVADPPEAGPSAVTEPGPRRRKARPPAEDTAPPAEGAGPAAEPVAKPKPRPRAKRPRPAAAKPRGKARAGARRQAVKRHVLRRLWSGTPPAMRTLLIAMLVVVSAVTANFVYQVVKKPAEMLFPVSGVLKKTPTETWREYGALFRSYSTRTISPELLAALAQVEGAGDPVAHTYWRWQRTLDPFSIYKPASSAVGMYQLTDAAFADARRFCIRDHKVVADGPWNDWNSCWFNRLYTRVIPRHAIELTAVSLDRQVHAILASRPGAGADQMENLAALIHLCGAGPARAYVRHGFHLSRAERCGDHPAADYVDRVNAIKLVFRRLAQKS